MRTPQLVISGRCSVCGLAEHSDAFGEPARLVVGLVLCQGCNRDLARTGWLALEFRHDERLIVQHREGPAIYRVLSGLTETLLLGWTTDRETAARLMSRITDGKEVVFFVQQSPEED